MASETPAIGWRDLLTLLSPVGRDQIRQIIERAKEERGRGWIEAIKVEYPTACWIIDLAANYTAEDAYKAVAQAYPNYPLWMAQKNILDLHAFLRNEIDKPRGNPECL